MVINLKRLESHNYILFLMLGIRWLKTTHLKSVESSLATYLAKSRTLIKDQKLHGLIKYLRTCQKLIGMSCKVTKMMKKRTSMVKKKPKKKSLMVKGLSHRRLFIKYKSKILR